MEVDPVDYSPAKEADVDSASLLNEALREARQASRAG